MTRPTTTAFTERWYATLPEHYRTTDECELCETPGWPLLRYLSLLGDQANDVTNLISRIQYIPPDDGGLPGDTSDLTDPATADLAWLPWLGQLDGVNLPPNVTGQAARDAVASAVSGFNVGTKSAIAAAAASALTGTRHVEVYDHSISTPGDGGEWDVLLVTASSETPDLPAVLAAVAAAHAKPAGVVLHHRAYSATWAVMEAAYGPTWATRNGKTWTQLQEVGL